MNPAAASITDLAGFAAATKDMNRVHYFDRPGMSFHALKDFGTISPQYYYRTHVTRELRRPSSASMSFGTAVHALTLEGPEAYAQQVVIVPAEHCTPSGTLSTSKATKEWRATLGDRLCLLTEADDALVKKLAARVRSHPIAGAVLDGADVEAELFVDGLDGPRKAKVDIIDKRRRVWDLKTTKSLDNIRDQVRDFCYVEQVTWYVALASLARKDDFTAGGLIVVETEEPHRVAIVQFKADAETKARARWGGWLDCYRECQAADVWPNDPTEPLLISAADLAA